LQVTHIGNSNIFPVKVSYYALKNTYKGFYQGYQLTEVDYIIAGIIGNTAGKEVLWEIRSATSNFISVVLPTWRGPLMMLIEPEGMFFDARSEESRCLKSNPADLADFIDISRISPSWGGME
jgi:hypothetical protein